MIPIYTIAFMVLIVTPRLEAQADRGIDSKLGHLNYINPHDHLYTQSPGGEDLKQGRQYLNKAGDSDKKRHWKKLYAHLAAACFSRSAQLDNCGGLVALAEVYALGLDGEPNYPEAKRCYEKAARLGDAHAMVKLGSILEKRATPDDLRQAASWFTQAAELGDPLAMLALGVMHANGTGMPRDQAKALDWVRKSAERGNTAAMVLIGTILHSEGQGADELKQAAEWFHRAADQGDPQAMRMLGDCYERGRGVSTSLENAIAWYTKSAELLHPDSTFRLGCCYELGIGLPKNISTAVAWHREAAELGHWRAMFYLGQNYSSGKGVFEDAEESAKWFRSGGSRAPSASLASLATLLAEIVVTTQTDVFKDRDAMLQLARRLARLEDERDNVVLAHAWATALANEGNPKAVSLLQILDGEMSDPEKQESLLAADVLSDLIRRSNW